MPIKCSYKDCGYTNADGTSYCVKCGRLLGGMMEKTVVIKSVYKNMTGELDDIKKKGFAPSGFLLISQEALGKERNNHTEEIRKLKKEFEDYKSEKTINDMVSNYGKVSINKSEYDKLKKSAKMSMWDKIGEKTGDDWWNLILFFVMCLLIPSSIVVGIIEITNSLGNSIGIDNFWSGVISILLVLGCSYYIFRIFASNK